MKNASFRLDQLPAPSSDMFFNGQNIKGLAEPLDPNDGVSRSYLDGTAESLQPQGENIVGFGYEPCGGVLRIDDNDPRITYSPGDWTRYHISSSIVPLEGTNGLDATWSNVLGAWCKVKFKGTALLVRQRLNTARGIIGVSVDGGTETLIDLYSVAANYDGLTILASGLTFDDHEVLITIRSKNILASANYMEMYYFEVIQTTTSSVTLALDEERDKSSALVDGNRITSLSNITSTIPEITQLLSNANLTRTSPTLATAFSDSFDRSDGAVGNGWTEGTILSNKFVLGTHKESYNGSSDWGDREVYFQLYAPTSSEFGEFVIKNGIDYNCVYCRILHNPGNNIELNSSENWGDDTLLSSMTYSLISGNPYYFKATSKGNIYSLSVTDNPDYVTGAVTIYGYYDRLSKGNIGFRTLTEALTIDSVVVKTPVPYGWECLPVVGACYSVTDNIVKCVNTLAINSGMYLTISPSTMIPVVAGNSYTFKIKRELSAYTSGNGALARILWYQTNGSTLISYSDSAYVTATDADFVEVTLTATAPALACYATGYGRLEGIGTCEWKEPLFELTSTATGIFHLKEFRSDLISLDNTGSVVRTQGYEDEIGYRVEAEDGSISKFYRPKETIHHWDRVKTWYTNGWTQDILSGVPRIYTGTLNEALYVSFVGTGLSFTLSQSLTRGIIGVSVDGGTEFLVDQYNADTVKVVSNLPYGQHTVKFRITATMSITGSVICLFSYFDIYVPKIPTLPASNVKIGATIKADPDHGWIRYEENEGVVYSGTWSAGTNPVHSYGTHKVSNTLNDYVEFTTLASGIRFVDVKQANFGIVEVFTDEGAGYESRGTVDQYGGSTLYQQVLFTRSMSLALNKIKLVCTHTKNASASDYYIGIDAFEVKNSLYVTDLRNQLLSKDDVDTLFRNHVEAVNPHLITASMLSAPTYTTAALTYYVDVVNGSDMNPGTATLPFKTITYCLSLIPKNLRHAVIIRVCAGNYEAEGAITIQGYFGEGFLRVAAWNGSAEITAYTDATNYELKCFLIYKISTILTVTGFELKDTTGFHSLAIENCNHVNVYYCDSEATNVSSGVLSSKSNVYVTACRFSNKGAALTAYNAGSTLGSSTNYGTGNTVGLSAVGGGVLTKNDATQPTGTTPESETTGGRILQQASPFKIIDATYDISTASGTQVISGVGFRPRFIEVTATIDDTDAVSIGCHDGSVSRCIFVDLTANHWNTSNVLILIEKTNSDYATAAVSIGADGCTLTWTKNSSPTGTVKLTFKFFAS